MTDTYEIERERLLEWYGALNEGRATLQVYRSGETIEKMEKAHDEIREILDASD